MKKIISVLLALTMFFSTAVIGASAEDTKELKITVANDLHYNHSNKATSTSTVYTTDYANKVSTGQLKLENELIIDEFLSRAEGDIILLPGDITDNGTTAEHEYMAAKLEAFETATGKKVFLIPGNHDYMQHRSGMMNAEKMKANYFDLCYNEATTVDTETASYVAELNDDYRLLAIDATKPGANQGLNERLYSWMETQLKTAKAEGKKVIAMSHYNLLEHLIFMQYLHANSILTPELNVPELFAQYNVKYTFTGHTHDQDIAAYTGSNGNTIYDVVTTSLNAYPCTYREVTFGEKVKFRAGFVDSIDTSALKGKITDATYTQATESFPEYARVMFIEGLKPNISGFLNANKVISVLKLDKEKDAEMCALLEGLVANAKELLTTPLYKADETEEGKSIEALVAPYGVTLPETEYKDVLSFGVDVYMTYMLGDENYNVLTKEFSLLTSVFNGMFKHLLKDIDGEDYASVMTFACASFGVDVPVDFFKYAGSGISKAQGIDIFMTAVAAPILLEIVTDKDVADNNVTLDGYDAAYEEEEELTFWEKIVKFFKAVFAYIARIFGF